MAVHTHSPTTDPAKRPTKGQTKDERVNIRISSHDHQLVREAAEATGTTVSDFVTSNAVISAQHVLADKRSFVLGEDEWEEFRKALDAKPTVNPQLAKLFRRPRLTRSE